MKKIRDLKNEIYPIIVVSIIVVYSKLLKCVSRYRFRMIIAFTYGINCRNRQLGCFNKISLNRRFQGLIRLLKR